MKIENKYIKIIELTPKEKTKYFEVQNKSGGYPLGDIYWYSYWRQYCFFPFEDMVFNSDCLELITNFLKGINVEQRKNWKQKISNN